MEFLSDDNELAASYVLLFVREAVHKLPELKPVIVRALQVRSLCSLLTSLVIELLVACSLSPFPFLIRFHCRMVC